MNASLLRWLWYLFLFSIPLGTKKFLLSFSTPFSNFYTSEYTAGFLYGSDILFLVLLIVLLWSVPRVGVREAIRQTKTPLVILGLFTGLAGLSIFFSDYTIFGAYAFLRLVGAVGAGLLIWWMLRSGMVTMRHAMIALSLSAVFQAAVAFLQFVGQKSVGLWFLGETIALRAETPGVATIAVDGVSFLRAYGTLPHANILAGFLVIGLIALCYLFFKNENMRGKALALSGIVVVETGLLLTFSRSGWIVAAFAIISTIFFGLLRREYRKRTYELAFAVFLSLTFLIGILQFSVLPRAHLTGSEGPVQDRWRYNEMGVSLIAARPLGVGIGNELFYAYEKGFFERYDLRYRGQWQPIHNLYLLIGSEIGLAGLVAFLGLVFVAVRSAWSNGSFEAMMAVIMFGALLVSGLFDHFLWDLEAGRLMLWAVLGILLGVSARSSTDRTHPSEG